MIFCLLVRLTARPCDANGNFLDDPNADPPPRESHKSFHPFADRPSFECAELLFEKMAGSEGDINQLFNVLRAKNILDGHEELDPIFNSYQHLTDNIDDIEHGIGCTGWTSFSVRWNGPITPDSPSWKRQRYIVHTRDPLAVIKAMCASADFNGSWHTRPFKEFTHDGTRVFADLLSGHWAWKQAVSSDDVQSLLYISPSTHAHAGHHCRRPDDPWSHVHPVLSRCRQDDSLGSDWQSRIPPALYHVRQRHK